MRPNPLRILASASTLLLLALAGSPAVAGVRAARNLRPLLAREAHFAPDGLEGLTVTSLERTPITADVAWYRIGLEVGPGEHDRILLHRVVRERAPWVARRAVRGVFLTHGDGWGFAATFLTSLATPEVADTQNLPVFLAQNGVDVWGLDFRWALVPEETADLTFLAGWGFTTMLEDLDHALGAARLIRVATGSGVSKLTLLGFSRGGQLGWARLSAETQLPAPLRHLKGFVAMEHTFKTDDEAVRAANCASHAALENLIANGTVYNSFTFVGEVGDLAASAPNDPSPYFPVVSNADFAELIGADSGGGSIPYFHSVGGTIDPDTLATELLYTQPALWFALLSGVSPYQPLAINRDGAALVCDQLDSPFDDHLGEITVPILYLGAAGANGERGLHTATLVASTDVTSQVVTAGTAPELDWGHNELLLAGDAQNEVWEGILAWIEGH